MNAIFDLSHPITENGACTFSLIDAKPQVTFEEGDSHGMFFITTRVDNLHSNLCTHMDLPGHIYPVGRATQSSVGEYPIERFIGTVLVLDVSHKMMAIQEFFSDEGILDIEARDAAKLMRFLRALDTLEVGSEELNRLLAVANVSLSGLKGLVFHTGLGKYWKAAKFESWQYIYFFGPYLSAESCDLIVKHGLSFVGVDAFQLEHPIINFRGDELPLVVNPNCREYVVAKLKDHASHVNHSSILGNDLFIYENLNIPNQIVNQPVQFFGVPLNFQLAGMNDNALVRPCAMQGIR